MSTSKKTITLATGSNFSPHEYYTGCESIFHTPKGHCHAIRPILILVSQKMLMHLSSSSPSGGGGGGPRAIGGGIGDFVGIFQHVCVPVVGEMKGL